MSKQHHTSNFAKDEMTAVVDGSSGPRNKKGRAITGDREAGRGYQIDTMGGERPSRK